MTVKHFESIMLGQVRPDDEIEAISQKYGSVAIAVEDKEIEELTRDEAIALLLREMIVSSSLWQTFVNRLC